MMKMWSKKKLLTLKEWCSIETKRAELSRMYMYIYVINNIKKNAVVLQTKR